MGISKFTLKCNTDTRGHRPPAPPAPAPGLCCQPQLNGAPLSQRHADSSPWSCSQQGLKKTVVRGILWVTRLCEVDGGGKAVTQGKGDGQAGRSGPGGLGTRKSGERRVDM